MPVTPSVVNSDVDQLPVGKVTPRKNAYAVVFGIEQYREKLPKADFADRDATVIGEYLTKVLGYPSENVIVRLNDRVTRTDMVKYFEEWLKNNVEPGGSVFVYYSGHGAPNTKTGEAYLVPYDGDPSFVDSTAYPLKQLYAALDKLPVKDVTVVLDSCFSGAGGRSVLAEGVRPMALAVENTLLASGKTVVLAASSGNQISNTFKDKGHGLLTYFFLKGLRGEGDLNKDGKINMAELYEYLKPNVQKIARKHYNNEQIPQLLASPEVLAAAVSRLLVSNKTTMFDTESKDRVSSQAILMKTFELLDRLSPAEKVRMREIISGVMRDPDYLTADVHAEFWTIGDKLGWKSLPPDGFYWIRDWLGEMTTTYMRYYYEDALTALKTGRPFKSLERGSAEKRLLKSGLIPDWRIAENDKLMEKIAAKEPVSSHGSTFVYTEEIIKDALDNIEASRHRLDALYTPPK